LKLQDAVRPYHSRPPQSFPIQSDLQSTADAASNAPLAALALGLVNGSNLPFAGTNCLHSGCRTRLTLLAAEDPRLSAMPISAKGSAAGGRATWHATTTHYSAVDEGCQWGPVGEPVPIVQCHGIISPSGYHFGVSVAIEFLGDATMLVTGKLPRAARRHSVS
jgi:hypothetical protein